MANFEEKDLIDNRRYPLHSPASSSYLNLVSQCQQDLNRNGACMLPGFLTTEATAQIVSEIDRIAPKVYPCNEVHNVFLEENDISFPEDHPRRLKEKTSLGSLAYDHIEKGDALRALYEWDPLLHFVAAILGEEKMYRMADPMAALTVNVMNNGQNHGWHFDESLVTTTVILQKPLEGGQFQYVANLRGEDWNDYESLNDVLLGNEDGIQTLPVEAGTLLLFAGYFQLHRVTPVVGDTTRYVATLCFKDEPGVCNSPKVQKLFYGRTASV